MVANIREPNDEKSKDQEIGEFRRQLDLLLEDFSPGRVKTIRDLNSIRDRKIPLVQQAETLGLNFTLEISRAELRRKEKSMEAS
jgi:hypothetical protein